MALGALILWAGVYATRRLGGADFWWHTAFGRYIWETKSIPDVDMFTFTHHGGRWVNISWFIDFVFYVIHSIGGITGLAATKTVLIVMAVATMAWGAHRPGRSVFFIPAAALALDIHWTRFILRPFLVTALLTALSMALIERDRRRRRADPAASSRELWWLVPVAWLWACTHGAFPILYGLLGAYGLECLVQGRPRAGAPDARRVWSRHFRFLVVLGCACVGITLAQPYGLWVFWRMRVLFGSSSLIAGTGEWQPLMEYTGLSPRLFWTWWSLIALLVMSFATNRRRVSVFRILAVVGPGFLAFTAVRHLDVFLYIAVPVIAANLNDAWDTRRAVGPRRPAWSVAWAAVVVGSIVIASVRYLRPTVLIDGAVQRARAWAVNPYAFAETATAHLIRHPTGGRVFNEFEQGGYILWHRFPEPVYIDSKGLDEPQMRAHWEALTDAAAFAEATTQYDLRAVVMTLNWRTAPLYARLARDPAWTLELLDAWGYLFTRREGPPVLRAVPPGDPAADLPDFVPPPLPPFDPGAASRAPAATGETKLGQFWTAADMPRRAAAAYHTAVMASPNWPRARVEYAQALLQLGQTGAALTAIQSLERVPGRTIRAAVDLTQAAIALAAGDADAALEYAERAGPAAGERGYRLRLQLLMQRGDYAAAVQEGRRWVRRYPSWGEARSALAVALRAQGDVAGAVRQTARAVRTHPDRGDLFHLHGVMLEAAGETERAQAAFARARELGYAPEAGDP